MRRCPRCEHEMGDAQTHCTKCSTFLGMGMPTEEERQIENLEVMDLPRSRMNWVGGVLAGLATPWWILSFFHVGLWILTGFGLVLMVFMAAGFVGAFLSYPEKQRRSRRFLLGYMLGLIGGASGGLLFISTLWR